MPRPQRPRVSAVSAAEVAQGNTVVWWFGLASLVFITGLTVLAHEVHQARAEAGRLAEEKQMAWSFADSVLSDLADTRHGLSETAAERATLARALDIAAAARVKLRGELEDTEREKKTLARMAADDQQKWGQYSKTLKLTLDTEQTHRALAESSVTYLENETAQLAQAKDEVQRRNEEAVAANRSLAQEAAYLQMGVRQLRSENSALCSENNRLQSCLQSAESNNQSLQSTISQLSSDVSRLQSCLSSAESRARSLECEISRCRSSSSR